MLPLCAMVSIFLLLNACATTFVAPANRQASAISVDIDYYLVNPLGMEMKHTGHWLYFVRLDEQGNIPSMAEWQRGTWRNGTCYLLNVTPGYWAVAGIGYIDQGLIVDTKVVAPFPEGLVRESKTNLEMGKVAYLGTYKVVSAKEVTSMDSVQQYYMKTFLAREAELDKNQILENLRLDFKKGGGVVPTTYTLLKDNSRRKAAINKMGPAWTARAED